MFVRLALESDEDDFVAMGAANVAETLPGAPFDEPTLRRVFQDYLAEASPTIFLCEQDRQAIGLAVVDMGGYLYRTGFFVAQRVLYVRPEKRGTRASVLLVKHYTEWAKRLGAVEILGGNDNDFKSERTKSFLEHFGFRQVGYTMSKRLCENDHGCLRTL